MSTHPLLRTFPAYSLTIRRNTGVGLIEGVAVLAMGFIAAMLPSLPFELKATALQYAGAALPVTFNPLGAFLCVLVTANALRLLAEVAAASSGVLFGSDRLHVGWVHAIANSAEVVDNQPLGDRANHLLVDHSVGNSDSLLPPEVGVSRLQDTSCTKPALPWLSDGRIFIQQLIKIHSDNQCTRLLQISGVLT